MKKVVLTILFLISFAPKASAQVGTPTSLLSWDQDATTLTDAQTYTYRYYENAIGTILPAVICVGTVTPFQCSVTTPAFTVGSHTITMTASNIIGESIQSTPPFVFTFVVTAPKTPKNLHFVPKP